MNALRKRLWCICSICVLAIPGCRVQMRAGFDSPDPQERAIALARVSQLKDTKTIPKLIEALDSVDPAARLLAITALKNRTDKRFGYLHFDPPWRRAQAVARWEAWWQGLSQEQREERVSVPER